MAERLDGNVEWVEGPGDAGLGSRPAVTDVGGLVASGSIIYLDMHFESHSQTGKTHGLRGLTRHHPLYSVVP